MKLRINTDRYDGRAMRRREIRKAFDAQFCRDDVETVVKQITVQIDLLTQGELGLHTRAVY